MFINQLERKRYKDAADIEIGSFSERGNDPNALHGCQECQVDCKHTNLP